MFSANAERMNLEEEQAAPEILVLVISIEAEDGPRRVSACRELRDLGLGGRVVNGVTDRDKEVADIYSPRLNKLLSKYDLSRREIACYASHRRAWRELLASDRDCALILEDDFCVSDRPALRHAIKDCLFYAPRWDIVKFCEFRRRPALRSVTLGTTELVVQKNLSGGTVGYLINRGAAKRLLSRKRVFRQVDEDFSWYWELGIRLWVTSADFVQHNTDGVFGSSIEQERQLVRARPNGARLIWANVIAGWKHARSMAARLGSISE